MNPYEVLGVGQDATDAEVKAAYRKLVKKYHPDRYAQGSAEQAAAAEKLKQVNAAYDTVVKMRQGGFSAETSGGSPRFAQVRAAIQRGDLGTAEMLLNGMRERPAEWHYLMGIVLLRRGWSDGAYQHFTMAYQMEPGNRDYENAVRMMERSAGMYTGFGEGEGGLDKGAVCRQLACCGACAAISCLSGSWFCCC